MILWVGFWMISCNQKNQNETKIDSNNQQVEQISEATENFDWLLGKWKRLDGTDETEMFEYWEKNSSDTFLGHGFLMNSTDTVWQEKMVLSNDDSNWTLKVETPGNNDMVEFTLVEQSIHSFTVENALHDFPKRIAYWKDNEQLKALVKGDSMELEYEFERIGIK